MTVECGLVAPEFFHVYQARLKQVFRINIFFASIFRSATSNHLVHDQTGRGKVIGRNGKRANDEQHVVIVYEVPGRAP